MSLDLFLVRFENGEPAGYPRSLLLEIFSKYDPGKEDDGFLSPEYPDGSRVNIVYDDDAVLANAEDDTINGVMFGHWAGDQFLDDLFEMLKRSGGALVWPGDSWAVADASLIPHMLKDLLDSRGPPIVVSSVDELFSAINADIRKQNENRG